MPEQVPNLCPKCGAEGVVYRRYLEINEETTYNFTSCCKCRKEWIEKDCGL
jgi:DNA-directed RNA polymerase subunit M/transcription elongation factor TFIIS